MLYPYQYRAGKAEYRFLYATIFCLLSACTTLSRASDWPEAAGPQHNFIVDGSAPTSFSVSRNEGVIWRTPLPNTGESTPIISGNYVFVTCHAPITADAQLGSMIFGLCFDAKSGRELWRRDLPGTRETDMASGFSDNTASSPVTDGKYVCFINMGGSIHTYDFAGTLIWKYEWVPFGRHHSLQQEPILYHGNVIIAKTVGNNVPASATTKGGAQNLLKEREEGENYWTRLHAFDLASGKINWVAEPGTSVHVSSLFGVMANGTAAILTGRGGGHDPLEKPYGLSLLNADNGKAIWDLPSNTYSAHQNSAWNKSVACAFLGKSHQTIDVQSGELIKDVPLDKDVQICEHTTDGYKLKLHTSLDFKKSLTLQSNCLIGDYHYFRAHDQYLIGRIAISTGKVEYLQVPVLVVRKAGTPDEMLWDKAPPNDVKNNDDFVVCQDKRAMLSGWGHVSAASPIVIGDYIYMPTMLGMVYVLKWNAPILDSNALVSISDLGPALKTWSLASLSAAEGRIFARTIKELLCIGVVK